MILLIHTVEQWYVYCVYFGESLFWQVTCDLPISFMLLHYCYTQSQWSNPQQYWENISCDINYHTKTMLNQMVCIFHGIYCNTTQGWFYRFAPSQWEVALLCNNVSHWLGASLEPAQHYYCWNSVKADDIPVHSISWFIELQSALCD